MKYVANKYIYSTEKQLLDLENICALYNLGYNPYNICSWCYQERCIIKLYLYEYDIQIYLTCTLCGRPDDIYVHDHRINDHDTLLYRIVGASAIRNPQHRYILYDGHE